MTKRFTMTCISVLFAILTLCVSVVAWAYAGDNYQYYFDEIEIYSDYAIGETFTVPQCKMHLGSKEFDTTFKVVFPDGKECLEQTFTLDQKGSYQLIYQGFDQENNNTRLNSLNFSVAPKLYEMVGENVSSKPEYKLTGYNGTTGIVANIMNGNALRFNNTINLSKLTKEEGILEFFHIPTNVGYLDGFFKITLTDAYDENNSVSILVRKYNENSSDGWYNAYIMVSFNGGDEVGLRFNNNKNNNASSIHYNGAWHQLDKNNELGTCISYSMIGTPRNNVPIGGETLKFSYDYNEKKVYANGIFVSDLDDTVFYSNTFSGFTTGEVFLSISGFNYSQSTVNPVILSVAQMDISNNVLFDNQPPVIDVDLSSFNGDIVGEKDKAFTLFPATAVDKIDGKREVIAKVYRNYYSSKIFVPVIDGKFVPDQNTDYFIEYSATDFSGNNAKEIVKIKILNKNQPLGFTVNGLNLNGITAGTRTTLFYGVSVSGDIYGNKTSVKAVVKNLSNGQEILLDDSYSFMPILGGKHQLIVSVSDYVDTVTQTVDFTVVAPDTPVFMGEPFVERYYIKGATYRADDFCAYTIADGLEKAQTKVYLKEDGGKEKELNGEFTVTASDNLQFKYVTEGNYYETQKLEVVDVGFGGEVDLARYFHGDVTSQTTESYIKYTVKNFENGISSFDFINSVQAESLSLSLGFDKVIDQFETFNVYLTDAYDISNQIKLSFINYQGKTALLINGTNRTVLSKNYFDSEVLYNLRYNNSNKTINVDGDAVVYVENNLAGQTFAGFTGYDVYITFEFTGAKENASVNIYELNGQTFNSNNYILPPSFTHTVSVGEISIGQTFKMSKIIVDDVLDPFVTVSDFYVMTPSGNIAYSIDNIKLDGTADYKRDYEILATEYGAYTIYMNAYNSSGNYSYLPVYEEVWVVDMVAPTIELGSRLSRVVSVGSEVKLPKINVSDDNTALEDIKVYVIVRFADGTFRTVKNQKFTADKKGEYTVMFVAYDQNQNMAVNTVVVKAE